MNEINIKTGEIRVWAWVVKCKRLAKKKKVVNSYVTCRKAKVRMRRQIMADLPPETTHPTQSWAHNSRLIWLVWNQGWSPKEGLSQNMGYYLCLHGFQSHSYRGCKWPVHWGILICLQNIYSRPKPSKKTLVWSWEKLHWSQASPWRALPVPG